MSTTPQDEFEHRRSLLDAWVEKRREIARLEAEAAALLAERERILDAEVDEHPFHRDAIRRSMIAEYSAAGHISKGTMEYAFFDARMLERFYPAVTTSFGSGAVTAAHVHAIVEAGIVVRDAIAEGRADAGILAVYEAAALTIAEQDTPARTRVHVRQVAAALAGETVVERHARARKERSVTMRSVDDGLALLMIVLPEHLAAAIMDRLTRLAQHIMAAGRNQEPIPDFPPFDPSLSDDGPDPVYPEDLLPDADVDDLVIFGTGATFTTDPLRDAMPDGRPIEPVESLASRSAVPADDRTLDEVRADLLSDLLLAGDPSTVEGDGLDHIQARIQVTVAASTLSGGDDRPAELDGHGPLHPDVARELAGRNTGWTRLFLAPTGAVTETDTYTPTEPMRRHLRARDQHCRFPGCRMPVHRCQIDHNHDHAKGGRTALDNLSHFCAGHHVLKHPDIDERHRWSARQRPDGTVEWVSPLGRTYADPPPRRVMFV